MAAADHTTVVCWHTCSLHNMGNRKNNNCYTGVNPIRIIENKYSKGEYT